MKKLFFPILAATLCSSSLLLAADDDAYRLSNDVSYLDGSIDSRQHIYYSGDTIDIRVTMQGDTALLASQAVDIYLGIFKPSGSASFRKISNYEVVNSQRLYFIQNLTSSVVSPGTYQLALIATKSGGNPGLIQDWYNGLGGLLETEALLFTEAAQSGDADSDGYWDDDYDRDGFYGDDDRVFKDYTDSNGTYYKSSEYREWEDDDWSDDEDEDWDDDDDRFDWDD